MTYPIIKTDNYILITSDEEIKEGDYWHYLGEKDDPVENVLGRSWFEKLHDVKMYKKVIAHLPLNNEPILEGVPLLPPLPNEEVKYDFAEMFYNLLKATYSDFDEWVEAKEYKKYKNISQPKLPVGFKCETKSLKQLPFNVEMSVDEINKPKIYKGVIQGEWIFE